MKKKIAILGSTGSIGKNLVDIINSNKKNFEVVLLSANKNDKLLIKQAKKLNVKNIIISDQLKYKKIKKNYNFKIYNNFDALHKIFKKKVDYIMSSITGIDGLEPTLKSIKYTKKIAIANKESIICGWNLIKKELDKHNTIFMPVDSEHFSIWSSMNTNEITNIDKVYITASGGPFKNLPLSKFSKIRVVDAIKHPNWKMGKKISIDSSTMMNKVFEVIEAKNIFNLSYDQIKILINKDSYLHAIIKYKNGISKMIIHDTDMKIPIFNTLYENNNVFRNLKKINFKKINNLNLTSPDLKKFPLIKILKKMPKKITLFNTLIVAANDTLVDQFIKKKIQYHQIPKIFFSFINNKKFNKLKFIVPRSINDIIKLKKIVQIKIESSYI